MKTKFKILAVMTAAILLIASVAYSDNQETERELLVYSLGQYGYKHDSITGADIPWKDPVSIPVTNPELDPYRGLWNALYAECTGMYCAMGWNGTDGSLRRQDSEVTVNSMAQSTNGWQDADMVFFYGHNTMIKPQWKNDDDFGYWVQTATPIGQPPAFGHFETSDWRPWGTADMSYIYHAGSDITNASLSNSYSVFYAYNPLTSVLIGKDYAAAGTWYTENTKYGSDTARSGYLGEETEWIIANGCNAVTVADYNATSTSCSSNNDCSSWQGCINVPGTGKRCHNITSNSLGVNAWRKSWNKLHMVLGHYHGTRVSYLPNLTNFGTNLKNGDTIKDAYFDEHTSSGDAGCKATPTERATRSWGPGMCKPAVIALSPRSCCNDGYCPPAGCDGDFLNSETWTDPMPDLTESAYYTTSWQVHYFPLE